jgi:hypothetical protein
VEVGEVDDAQAVELDRQPAQGNRQAFEANPARLEEAPGEQRRERERARQKPDRRVAHGGDPTAASALRTRRF